MPQGISVICQECRVHKDPDVFMFWFPSEHLFIFPSACDLYLFTLVAVLSSPHKTALFFLVDISKKSH